MEEKIFKPLQMNDSAVEGSHSAHSSYFVRGLIPISFLGKERFLVLPHWNYSLIQGAGAVLSTVNDIYLWNVYLSERSKADPQWRKIYFESGNKDNEHYSFGWVKEDIVLADGTTEPVFWHFGEDPGYCSYNLRVPGRDLTLVALWNTDRCLLDGNWNELLHKEVLNSLK